MSILVSPLSHVAELIARRRPDRVISVLDPGGPFPELGPSYAGRHLRLAFHDIHSRALGFILASPEHIAALLAFLDQSDPGESLLVHCRAGIARSTATAFIAACHRNPHASELDIALELRRLAPHARPNERVVELADAAMDRRGRMLAAITETGGAVEWFGLPEGLPFELPSRFDRG
jgi:predicted protein tyrosine phosphatase